VTAGPAEPGAARALASVRLAWGTVLVLLPGGLLGRIERAAPGRGQRLVVRLLGARHIVQAIVVRLSGSRRALMGGAAVDALHAASALLLAVADRRRRRVGLADALLASSFAAAGARVALRRPPSPGPPGATRPPGGPPRRAR
jgi:hypothetical protein